MLKKQRLVCIGEYVIINRRDFDTLETFNIYILQHWMGSFGIYLKFYKFLSQNLQEQVWVWVRVSIKVMLSYLLRLNRDYALQIFLNL